MRHVRFTVVVGAMLLLTGCCGTRPTGSIYIDRPEVFTRERLVNRRLAELQWLEKELERPVGSTLQGARERRSFSGLTAGLEAQFDPLGAAGAAASSAAFQSGQKVTELQNGLTAEALQQKLKALERGDIGYKDVLGTNAAPTGSVSNASASFTPTNAAIGLGANASGLSNLPGLPSGSNIVVVGDRVQLTASEQFRDRLAYRDAVSAVMRERELDDTHDHAGMTLYTLKFDLSVVPGKENNALGRVLVSMDQIAEDGDSNEQQYYQWVESFRQVFDTEVISIQRRYLQHYLTDQELRRLTVAAWDEETRLNDKGEKALADTEREALGDYRALRRTSAGEQSEGGGTNGMPLRALCRLMTKRFAQAVRNAGFEKLINFGRPRSATGYQGGGEGFLYLVPVDTNETGVSEFAKMKSVLTASAEPFVYTVEPKEGAQNLSDTSARESVVNLSLALAAALPQIGTRASGYVNYVKRQQYLLETIKRSPSLVGFIRDRTSFGWIIGPRFRISKKGKLDFEHTAVQQSVQATIAVPAWWSVVKLVGRNRWLDGDASEGPVAGQMEYNVRLRPDFEALTRALLEKFDPAWFNNPQIHPQWDVDRRKWGYAVKAGKSAQILIRGRNLWRNPQIFIGSQGTRKYEILPDMAGLVATFDEVQAVQTMGSGEGDAAPRVDLRVVTSDGETVLKNAVSIISGGLPGQQARFVSMPQAWGVTNASYTFRGDTTLAPKSYHNFLLTLRTQGANPSTVATNFGFSGPRGDELVFQLPAKSAPEKDFVNVQVKTSPGSDPVSVLEGGEQPMVLFLSSNQAQFKLETNSLTISTNPTVKEAASSCRVLMPDPDPNVQALFWQAWPGLQSVVGSGPAVLQLKAGTAIVVSSPAVIGKSGQGFLFPVDYQKLVGNLPLGADGAAVDCETYVVAPADEPRFTVPAGKLTVKRKNSN